MIIVYKNSEKVNHKVWNLLSIYEIKAFIVIQVENHVFRYNNYLGHGECLFQELSFVIAFLYPLY